MVLAGLASANLPRLSLLNQKYSIFVENHFTNGVKQRDLPTNASSARKLNE